MLLTRRRALASLAALGGLTMAGRQARAEAPITIVLGTATPGGGFPLYGGAVV